MALKIEYLNKNDLKPYANNAKIHTAEQIEQIKRSIEEFSFNDPIAIWHDNEIIEGHGRLMAVMEMPEISEVPVIRLDGLTDEQRKAYAIAHNKLTMNTDFDLDLLSLELESIGDLDMTDFGFNEAEILELTIDDSPEEPVAQTPYYQQSPNPPVTGDFEAVHPQAYESPIGYQEGGLTGAISRTELEKYESRADNMDIITRRVIIVFKTEDEESFVRSLLNIPAQEKLGVIYLAEKLMNQGKAEAE